MSSRAAGVLHVALQLGMLVAASLLHAAALGPSPRPISRDTVRPAGLAAPKRVIPKPTSPSRAWPLAADPGNATPVESPAELSRHDTLRKQSRPPALPPDYQTSIPDAANAREPEHSAVGDAALYELQLGRLARQVVRTYESDGVLLLPIVAFLKLAEIGHQASGGDGAINGRIEPAGERFRVDPGAHEVRFGERVLSVSPRELTTVNHEIYGSLELLNRLFDLSATIDREAAAVFVHNPEHLPLARRIQREAARAILIGGEPPPAPELIVRGRGGTWNGVVLAYELRSSSHDLLGEGDYNLGLATGAAGGSVLVRAQGFRAASPRMEASWTGIWPGSRWLTQLRLGDGASTGPRPEGLRGVSLTNAPLARPLLVEDMPFAGTLPPNWSLEAYRGGRLIGFDSVGPSGRYLLTLPVHYGENPVDLVAYGPLGEVRTFNRTFRALPSLLPPGAFEYGVSAGSCRSSRCSAAANLDLRYGVSRRWTIRGGVERSWPQSGASSTHPYASLSATLTNAMGLELEGVGRAFVRAGARFEPSVAFRLTADYVGFADSSAGSPFVPLGTRRQWSVDGRWTPTPRSMAVTLEAAASRIEIRSGSRTEARGGAAVRANGIVLRPYVRLDRSEAGHQATSRRYAGADVTILPQRALGPALGPFWAQGRLEAQDAHRPTAAAVTVSRDMGAAFRVEGGLRWERGLPGATFTLSVVSQLEAVRSVSLLTASKGESTRLDQSVGGSVVWGRNADLSLSSDQTLERGGIAGDVFLDMNGDGHRQAEEPPLPGTRVLVMNRWRTAAEDGHYQVWGLSPYEEVLIVVDTTSLASPWWVPAFGSAAVLPVPNGFRTLDVPVVIAGIVEGSLVLEGATSLPLERGFPVVFTETTTGITITVETFRDGSFYHAGLRPGHYAASVDAMTLASLHLAADTVRFTLARDVGDPAQSPSLRRDAALRARGPVVSNLRITLRQLP